MELSPSFYLPYVVVVTLMGQCLCSGKHFIYSVNGTNIARRSMSVFAELFSCSQVQGLDILMMMTMMRR